MRSTSGVRRQGIVNALAEGAHFHLARRAPAGALAFFVERRWVVRWDLSGRAPYQQETLPHPCVDLVLEAGRSAVHGVGTRRFGVRLEGEGLPVGSMPG